jgi:hypothetical protein
MNGKNEQRVFLAMIVVFFVLLAWIVARKHSPNSLAVSPEAVTMIEPMAAPNSDSSLSKPTAPAIVASFQNKPNTPSAPENLPASSVGNSLPRASSLSLAKVMPDKKTLRDEVAKNPEETPKALLAFSVDIAQRMEAASSSPAAAAQLFGELEECVLENDQTNEPARAAQALCLLNANRLGSQSSGLKSRYKDLENRANPDVVKLTRAML